METTSQKALELLGEKDAKTTSKTAQSLKELRERMTAKLNSISKGITPNKPTNKEGLQSLWEQYKRDNETILTSMQIPMEVDAIVPQHIPQRTQISKEKIPTKEKRIKVPV